MPERRLPTGVEVWDRSRMLEAQEVLRQVRGVTVIVHDQECATEVRRKRKRGKLETPDLRIVINERVCEGCGDCGVKSNCLSVHPVQTEFGRKTQIHQPSCNQDYSCLAGNCPSFLQVVAGHERPARSALDVLDPDDLPEPDLVVRADEFGMRITGIGGTGVVTVAQTIAVAALLDGRHVRGLDQTGLAQKGGPVVSDVKITTTSIDQSNRLAAADCDLFLVCDALTGAQEMNLSVLDPARSVAVTSTARVPTGQMVVDTTAAFPPEDLLLDRIIGSCRADASVSFDAQDVSEALFGTDQVANIMLVGAAYQAGALPLTWEALEQAIELNGVAVEMNLQAFRRGRQVVADPEGLQATVQGSSSPAPSHVLAPRLVPIAGLVRARPGSELERLVRIRVGELTAYQNRGYARRYAERVERVRARAAELGLGDELAEAVAANLYKLMAYKDEYEVSRLHLDSDTSRRIRGQFGADARVRVMLHPPVLKAMGVQRKIGVPGGAAGTAMFRALASMKHLRGTRLDVFGRDHVRVVERDLIDEYEQLLDLLVTALTDENHELAVRLAGLPDLVRGYDEVKLRNVEVYREQLALLRAQLTVPGESRPRRSGFRQEVGDVRSLKAVVASTQGERYRTRRVRTREHRGVPGARRALGPEHRCPDGRRASRRSQWPRPARSGSPVGGVPAWADGKGHQTAAWLSQVRVQRMSGASRGAEHPVYLKDHVLRGMGGGPGAMAVDWQIDKSSGEGRGGVNCSADSRGNGQYQASSLSARINWANPQSYSSRAPRRTDRTTCACAARGHAGRPGPVPMIRL